MNFGFPVEAIRTLVGEAIRLRLGTPLLICALAAACAEPAADREADVDAFHRGDTTFEKFLPLAQAGNARHQNLLGFMSFFGEGTPTDFEQAHLWFHLAADQGYEPARHNLEVLHGLGLTRALNQSAAELAAHPSAVQTHSVLDRPNLARANRQAAQPGQSTYVTYCAGCHGLNGIAAYVGSPSFAMGERMWKSDAQLLNSIRNGRGVMPAWGGKLPDANLKAVLSFVRGMEEKFKGGIDQALIAAPELYFLFGPMTENDAAYRRD